MMFSMRKYGSSQAASIVVIGGKCNVQINISKCMGKKLIKEKTFFAEKAITKMIKEYANWAKYRSNGQLGC